LHLAVVTNYYPDCRPNSEYALHLVDGLRRARPDCRVTVVAGRSSMLDGVRDADLVRAWRFGSPWLWRDIAQAVQRLSADAVLVNTSFTNWGSTSVANMAGFWTIPTLARQIRTGVLLHNLPYTMDTRRDGYRLSRVQWLGIDVACRLAARAHVTGFTLRRDSQFFAQRYKPFGTVCIEHGLLGACGEAGWPATSRLPTLLAYGYWGPNKDLEMVLRAVEATPGVRLVVAGASHPRFPQYLDDVRRRHPSERIEWLGYVSEEDTPGLFQAAPMVVLPYVGSTGTSGVLHQAAQYGRAILASHLSVLEEESNRLRLRVRYYTDESDLCRALRGLHDDASLLEDGRHNLAAAREHDMVSVGEAWWRALEGPQRAVLPVEAQSSAVRSAEEGHPRETANRSACF
jgi:hypothetical protein